MNTLKEFIRIVNERDTALNQVEYWKNRELQARELFDDLKDYCKNIDGDFWANYRRWSDTRAVLKPNWDYRKIMTNQEFAGAVMDQLRDFKFETNVPKFELEEEDS